MMKNTTIKSTEISDAVTKELAKIFPKIDGCKYMDNPQVMIKCGQYDVYAYYTDYMNGVALHRDEILNAVEGGDLRGLVRTRTTQALMELREDIDEKINELAT